MRYDLKNDDEYEEAKNFIMANYARDKMVEIKVVRPTRSLKSNSYLHLLLQICANEWGYSLPEIKTIWKRNISPNTFVYHKNDIPFIRSSADLNDKEMSEAIEQLKRYSSENGLDLPDPEDEDKIRYYTNQIQTNERYL